MCLTICCRRLASYQQQGLQQNTTSNRLMFRHVRVRIRHSTRDTFVRNANTGLLARHLLQIKHFSIHGFYLSGHVALIMSWHLYACRHITTLRQSEQHSVNRRTGLNFSTYREWHVNRRLSKICATHSPSTTPSAASPL